MVPGFVLGGIAVVNCSSGYIGFYTDNWLDSCIFGSLIKFDCAAKRTMIGNRTGLHAEFLHSCDKVWDFS